MQKYSSNTYYLLDKVLYVVVLLIVACLITYHFSDHIKVVIVGSLIAAVGLGSLLRLLSKLAIVEFKEEQLIVKYLLFNKRLSIAYSRIMELQHIYGYPVFSRNTIKYKGNDGGKVKKIKTNGVASLDDYMAFVKWLKSKNNTIHISFLPSDSIFKVEYVKEFGSL